MNEEESVWGDDELFESSDVYKTLSTLGFRDGKQFGHDIKRQEGFNLGFKIGGEIGKLYGKFLAFVMIYNIPLNEKLLNFKEFDSISLFYLEIQKIEDKLFEYPIEVTELYQSLKNKIVEHS